MEPIIESTTESIQDTQPLLDDNVKMSFDQPVSFNTLTIWGIVIYLYTVSKMSNEIFDIYRHRQQWYLYDPYMVVRITIQCLLLVMGFSFLRTFILSVSVCHKFHVVFQFSQLFLLCMIVIIIEHMYRYHTYMTFKPKNHYLKTSSCVHGNVDRPGCRITNCGYVDKTRPGHIYHVDVMGSICPNSVHYIDSARRMIPNKYREELYTAGIRIVVLISLMISLYI